MATSTDRTDSLLNCEEAVSLASHIVGKLDTGSYKTVTDKGVKCLADAVLTMDRELSRLYALQSEIGAQPNAAAQALNPTDGSEGAAPRGQPAFAAPSDDKSETPDIRHRHEIIVDLANARKRIYDLERELNAARSATGETWLPMMSAPLDGTEIEILFQHFDYWTCLKLEGKERADKQYRAVQRAHWIDHNGGGWTWHGMAGSPVGWRPISDSDSGSDK